MGMKSIIDCDKLTGELQLMPGTYNHTFQCMLPAGLPTSVEGEIGHIRYTTEVVLDIPMWPDKEFKEPFTVIKAINLNADPALRVIYSVFAFINFSSFLSLATFILYLYRRRPSRKKIKRSSYAVCCAAAHLIPWILSLALPLADTLRAKLLIWKST